MDYRVVKKSWQYVQPFWYSASVWQTDGQTDVQPISITCFSIADARKNEFAVLFSNKNILIVNNWKHAFEVLTELLCIYLLCSLAASLLVTEPNSAKNCQIRSLQLHVAYGLTTYKSEINYLKKLTSVESSWLLSRANASWRAWALTSLTTFSRRARSAVTATVAFTSAAVTALCSSATACRFTSFTASSVHVGMSREHKCPLNSVQRHLFIYLLAQIQVTLTSHVTTSILDNILVRYRKSWIKCWSRISYYAPDLRTEGHYKMMGGVCLSVCLSVACLDLTWERKDIGSLSHE